MKITIFPGKYHQNGWFSMAMLRVDFSACHVRSPAFRLKFDGAWSEFDPAPRSERWNLGECVQPTTRQHGKINVKGTVEISSKAKNYIKTQIRNFKVRVVVVFFCWKLWLKTLPIWKGFCLSSMLHPHRLWLQHPSNFNEDFPPFDDFLFTMFSFGYKLYWFCSKIYRMFAIAEISVLIHFKHHDL